MTQSTSPPQPSSQRHSVLFVNRSYWPDREATGQLLTELCQSLAESYDVRVLCGQPNSPENGQQYQKRGVQIRKGVAIRRVRHTQLPKSRIRYRIFNFISFCLNACLKLIFGQRADVIVCETDPPFSPFAGVVAATLRRSRLVFYLQDIYPDIVVQIGKLPDIFLIKLLRKMLVWCYCRADAMVVVSRDMRQWLIHHGVPAERIHVIHNWVDPTKVYPVKWDNPFRAEQLLDGKFVVMYSGNVGQTQRFATVLDAAEQLKHREDIVFMIVGGGVKLAKVKEACEQRGLDNVRFLDYQPKSRLAESLSAADLQLVMLDEKLTQLMMPSKLYSALAAGTPVLGIGSLDSELAQIVTTNDAGWFFASDSVDDVVACIESAAASPERLHEMGVAGRAICVEYFTRDVSVSHFNRVLSLVLSIDPPELHSRHPHDEAHFAPVQAWLRRAAVEVPRAASE